MEIHPAKRIEIVIETPMLARLGRALEDAGATGYTVLPVLGGAGRTGAWSREGQIGAEGMAAVVTIVAADRLEPVLDAIAPLVRRQIGVFTVTDCTVLRPERF